MPNNKSKRDSIESILKRYNKAIARKDLYRDMYESAYAIALPQRNLYSNQSEGSKKMQNVYDSTGMISVNGFANNMQNSLTPPFKRWVELKAGPAIPKEQRNEINEVLESVTEIAFEILNSSNFNTAVSEFYYDLAVGTGVLLVLPGNDYQPINFVCVPIAQIALDDGPFGTVGCVYRTHEMSKRLMEQTWPDAKIQTLSDEDLDSKHKIVEASYQSETGTTFYDVILQATSERIVEREFSYNPWIVTRIAKIAGEVFGRGPLIQASPDLQMLNKVKELSLMHAQLNAFGIYTVADSDILNVDNITLNPGMFIPVSRNAGPNGPSIAPLPRAGDVNLQQFMVQELQTNIRQMLLDNKLPPDTGPVRSATEIMARIKQIKQITGPFFGRLMFEFVQPLWQAIISILLEKNLISLPPELSKIDSFFVRVKVLSPIAQEQALEDVENTVNAMQIVQSLGGEQALMMAYKMEDFGEWIGNKLGTPNVLIRSEEERKQIMMQAQQAQQAQLEQQQPQQ